MQNRNQLYTLDNLKKLKKSLKNLTESPEQVSTPRQKLYYKTAKTFIHLLDLYQKELEDFEKANITPTSNSNSPSIDEELPNPNRNDPCYVSMLYATIELLVYFDEGDYRPLQEATEIFICESLAKNGDKNQNLE